MPYKCAKPGTQIYQIRRPLRDPLERKSSYPFHSVSDKGIGHTYNEEKQTRSQNAEAERSIIGCETVKIRARTTFGFNDSKHRGINWRIVLVKETAQKISLPFSDLGIHCASKAIPCENKHEKRLEPPTVWTLKTSKESTLAALWLLEKVFTLPYFNRSTKESRT